MLRSQGGRLDGRSAVTKLADLGQEPTPQGSSQQRRRSSSSIISVNMSHKPQVGRQQTGQIAAQCPLGTGGHDPASAYFSWVTSKDEEGVSQ
jgi:hypothetical protein